MDLGFKVPAQLLVSCVTLGKLVSLQSALSSLEWVTENNNACEAIS